MKTAVSTLTPIVIVLLTLSGCTRTAPDDDGKQKLPPPPAPKSVTITLDATADNPDIGPDQDLDFFLPTARPNTKYWVTFLNRSPCTKEGSAQGDDKKFEGSYEKHASCHTKSRAGGNTNYVFTWGSIPPLQTTGGIIPYNAVKCQPAC